MLLSYDYQQIRLIAINLQRYGFKTIVFLLSVQITKQTLDPFYKHDNLSHLISRHFERINNLIVLTLLLKSS